MEFTEHSLSSTYKMAIAKIPGKHFFIKWQGIYTKMFVWVYSNSLSRSII